MSVLRPRVDTPKRAHLLPNCHGCPFLDWLNMSSRIYHSLRRLGTAVVMSAGLVGFVLTSGPGFAIGPGSGPGGGSGGKGGKGPPIDLPPGTGGGGTLPPPPPGKPIPELSPGATASALVLLTGGTLILTDRLRRRTGRSAHAST